MRHDPPQQPPKRRRFEDAQSNIPRYPPLPLPPTSAAAPLPHLLARPSASKSPSANAWQHHPSNPSASASAHQQHQQHQQHQLRHAAAAAAAAPVQPPPLPTAQQNINAPNMPLPPMNMAFPLPPVASFASAQFPPPQSRYAPIDPSVPNFTSSLLTAPSSSRPTPPLPNPPARSIPKHSFASRNQPQPSMASRFRDNSSSSHPHPNKNQNRSNTPNGHHYHALRSIAPVAQAIEQIPDDSPIISSLAKFLDPMSASLAPPAQRQRILNFAGFSPGTNPSFRALLELQKNELEVLAWVFCVPKNGRKDDVAKRISNSLRAPLKLKTPSYRRPPMPVRNSRAATTLPSNINTPDHMRMHSARANDSPPARGSMPSLMGPPASASNPRANNLLQDLERHLQAGSSQNVASTSILAQMNGAVGQVRGNPAQGRNKQVRDMCQESLRGYDFKTAENPFNEPMNIPLGAKYFVVFTAVQLSRGNSDPVLIFPTPPPIDPAKRPEVHGGQMQIHLRCLKVEGGKPCEEWKQAWPFPASCRVNGHIVQLNQAQRYTNGKLAGLDTATDITAYLRKYKSAMSESNRVTLRRQSSTATPASGQFVMFAQEILVYSRETMTKKVHDSSEKYWQEYRKGLERKGQILPSASRFEMARHGVVLFLSDPDGVTVSSMKVSLRCPLALTRIETPVKGKRCQHVQCFDLKNFLEYTRRSSKFECPVCNKNTAYPSLLVVSPYIEYALEKYKDCDEVEIFQDGSMVAVERKQTGVASDDEDEDGLKPQANGHVQANPKPAAEVVDLTLDSDDDDDAGNNEDVPLPPRRERSPSLQFSVANLLDGNNRNTTFQSNSLVVPQFVSTTIPTQGSGNLEQIRDDTIPLDQDLDITFNSGFVPWAEPGQTTNEINVGPVHVTPSPHNNNNNNNWPDVITLDSD